MIRRLRPAESIRGEPSLRDLVVRHVDERFWRLLPILRYSRYDDSDPLDHGSRRALYERVRDSPGAYLSSLADETGLPLATARYHLRVLERERLIHGAKIGGKRRFFPLGTDDPEAIAAVTDDATGRVLGALARRGPSSVSALAADLDRDPSTVTHHLSGLEAAALVERRREGRSVISRLTPAARELLDDAPAPVADNEGAVAGD